jgi:hypothetical protein
VQGDGAAGAIERRAQRGSIYYLGAPWR